MSFDCAARKTRLLAQDDVASRPWGPPSSRAEERAPGEVLKSRDLRISHTRVRRSFDCAARMTRLLAQDDVATRPQGSPSSRAEERAPGEVLKSRDLRISHA